MNNLPFTEGQLDAPFILIGEAPGAVEERTGRPFQGPAGDLLNQCLHSAGIPRSDCYITNVLKFRPANNDASAYVNTKKGEENELFTLSKSALYAELAQTTGEIIICLGETALYALCNSTGISKRRGSVYTQEVSGRTRYIIPVLHPAAALRTYAWRSLIIWDLLRAAEIRRSGWTPVERTIRLAPTTREARDYIRGCMDAPLVGFDTEVVNQELSCFALAMSASDVMCIPLHRSGGNYFTPEEELDILTDLGHLLAEHPIVGQNLNFDYTFMLSRYGIYMKNIEDTMVAQAVLYPDFPKGLDFITSIYTTEPYYKDEGKMWNNVTDYNSFWAYNAKDAAVCVEAFPKQLEELEQLGNLATYYRQRSTIQQLAYMQHRGLRMDHEGMLEAARKATEDIERFTEELRELTKNPDFNANSPKQVKTYFYGELGLKPYLNKGKPTTDDTALTRLKKKGYREAELILDIRDRSKARGTYYLMTLDEDKRLRCSMNPVGTKQGRFSSSKTIFGTGGNMQNQPRDMQKFMLADEGCFFIALDLGQAENRIVAVLANDEKMLEAFANGVDIHSLTASYIVNKKPEDVLDEEGTAPVGPSHWSERDLGKRTNHGLNYDMSYVKFALINEMLERDAKMLITKYFSIYPKVRSVFHEFVKRSIRNESRVTNCFGRTRLFLDRISDETFREGYSFIPQSTVADIMNEWGLGWIEQNSTPGGYFESIEMINTVHDSLVLQAPLNMPVEDLAESITALVRSLEQIVHWQDREFRIPADMMIGTNLNKKQMQKVKLGGILGEHYLAEDTLKQALEVLRYGQAT